MRWVGDGSELWRVRVDLFAPDREAVRVAQAHHALQRQLTASDDAATRPGEVAADQGTGIAGRPVIGLSFWVRADDVVVIPNAAVARPDDPAYPPMPD
jgi:hypothetical protein